ncbi:DUF421 domain-containing protein [Hymenobacter sp. PAMC 26628]|uniref:DUF421 domain-containing protein n=1 Tax=Hymenobacter sp. PAMC 26628 TaxID=1484118 RepID=UPI00077011C1|nr:YetF domain-containing protein [Hymenobacter sp. PAMC 26628]AMJ65702.1 hypothetical protein AXW84_09880 [Hymenobacter sp. PAMC 26628]
MKKEDIVFSDWHRWVFGMAPPSFTGEVALRALVLFLVMLVIIRLLGRRMKGQMSVSELAVVLTLGAIIAGPMQIPTAGLLPSVAVLVAVLSMHRLSNWLAFKYRAVELAQQGDLALLVRDGCLDLAALQRQALSQEQLFGQLRNKNIVQLGELRRVYFESNGRLSIYKLPAPQPGLSVLPRADAPPPAAEGPAQGQRACATCGHVPAPADHAGTHCLRCGAENWVPAVLA